MGERRTPGRFVRQALLLMLIMLAALGFYLVVLWWRGPDAKLVTWTRWDEWLPFRPEWVWVYLAPYALGPVAVGLLSREAFGWFVRRGLVLVFVSLMIFIVVPTRTVRPDLSGLEVGATGGLYRNMIAIDGPAANAAPSLHVSLTCLLAWALVRDYPYWGATSFVGIGVVWLSTLLTRQHHLLDVASGVLLASLVARLPPTPVAAERAPNR